MTALTALTWPEWSHNALHAVIDRNRALDLARWPRFGVDLERARINFGDDTGIQARFDVQYAGTVNETSWLWAWANPVWDETATRDAHITRAEGERLGIADLAVARHEIGDETPDELGWRLASAAAVLTQAEGVYRFEAEPGSPNKLFLLLRRPAA